MTAEKKYTKAELLEQIHNGRKQLLDWLLPLGDERLSRKGPEGWAIKDHIAHLAAWENGIAGLLEGKSMFTDMQLDESAANKLEDEVNELLYRRSANLSVAEVFRQWESAHDHLVRSLAPLKDEDLYQPFSSFGTGGGDASNEPVVGWIIGNSFGHFEEHMEYIRHQFKLDGPA